jgi:hypothetical protein
MPKYKRGKGRRPRRQQKVYCRKAGGARFICSGPPVMGSGSRMSEHSLLTSLLQLMGFGVINPHRKILNPNKRTPDEDKLRIE